MVFPRDQSWGRFFLIYIALLLKSLTLYIKLVSTLMLMTFRNISASNPNDLYSCSQLHECFSKISNWCEYNSLKLNHAKTNVMFIDYRKKSTPVQFTFHFDHFQIQFVNQILVLSSIPRTLWNYSLIVKFVNLIFNFSVYEISGNHYIFLLEKR